MDIRIKEFAVDMNVENKGIELEVRSPDGSDQVGDCIVTKTQLTWCEGSIRRNKGTKIKWKDLATILSSEEAKKAALKAARSTS